MPPKVIKLINLWIQYYSTKYYRFFIIESANDIFIYIITHEKAFQEKIFTKSFH